MLYWIWRVPNDVAGVSFMSHSGHFYIIPNHNQWPPSPCTPHYTEFIRFRNVYFSLHNILSVYKQTHEIRITNSFVFALIIILKRVGVSRRMQNYFYHNIMIFVIITTYMTGIYFEITNQTNIKYNLERYCTYNSIQLYVILEI